MIRVITFASAKGGAGKTTLTATLGTFLSALGFRVLLVDCDEATNGLTLLYINQVNDHRQNSEKAIGIFEAYDSSTYIPDIVFLSENLHVLPASYVFERRPQLGADEFEKRLCDLKGDFKDDFDYIILDAQAGADAVSLTAADKSISDFIIVVSEYDPLSAAGVERLKGIAPESYSFDRTWILLNKMLPEFIESFSEFLSVSHYLPPLPWTADVVRSYAKRELALDFDQGNEFTLAALQTIRALPFTEMKPKIDRWTDNRAELLRQPVNQQYADMESLLEAANRRIFDIRTSRKRKSLILSFSFLIVAAIISAIFVIKLTSQGDTRIFSGDRSLEFYVTAMGAVFAVVAGMVVARMGASSFSAAFSIFGAPIDEDDDLELQRLERQRRLYFQHLEELEFLRSADAESILRRKFSPKP